MPASRPEPQADLDLLRLHEPIVRYTAGELFFPAAVEDYVGCCELVERVDGRGPRVALTRGEVTLEQLARIGSARTGPGLFLRLVDRPFSRIETFRWRHRPERPRFVGASRLAQVGVLSRVVDALLRVSLVIRGRVAAGTQAAAETLYRERIRSGGHPYYGRVVRNAGYVALQYWFFYPFNDWRSRASGVNDHEADWEQVVVYLAEQTDGSVRPAWVAYSAHDEIGDDLRRRWDDPDLTVVDGHPVVFAGLGSHSGAYLPGDYLSTFDPPAFGGLVDAFRRIARFFLPWTRHEERAGIGIPYVDYARGDGMAIGPGTGQGWTPQLIDDATAWVVDFRGLWGNDTADPLGGERGPAGPRYERSGRVRDSWGDVVEWSGLAKVAPNPQMAADLVSRRMDEVRLEAASVEAQLVGRRETVRATVACGEPVSGETEAELHSLAAQRTALSDEGRRLVRILSGPLPEPGPHEHLGHRALPQAPEPEVRHRFLAIWASLSTPLILGAVGLAFRPANTRSATALIVSWIFVLVAIEALARRRLLHFLAILAVVNLAASVVASVAGLTVFFGWRITVMVCFGVLGLLLFLANLLELSRS